MRQDLLGSMAGVPVFFEVLLCLPIFVREGLFIHVCVCVCVCVCVFNRSVMSNSFQRSGL